MDEKEISGEKLHSQYRPTIIADSEAEAQRLRADLAPGTHIEVDVRSKNLNPGTIDGQVNAEERLLDSPYRDPDTA